MPSWMKHKLESRLQGINNLKYKDDTTLMAESEEELKMKPLDESEKAVWKSWLKTQHSEN